MNRRTFLMAGAWLPGAAAGGAWPLSAQAVLSNATLVVVDRTLIRGVALAQYAARKNLPVFDTGDDPGVLWYTTLVPHLTSASALIGVTRASDYFVLHDLATRAGWRTDHGDGDGAPTATAAQHAHVAFVFMPCALPPRVA